MVRTNNENQKLIPFGLLDVSNLHNYLWEFQPNAEKNKHLCSWLWWSFNFWLCELVFCHISWVVLRSWEMRLLILQPFLGHSTRLQLVSKWGKPKSFSCCLMGNDELPAKPIDYQSETKFCLLKLKFDIIGDIMFHFNFQLSLPRSTATGKFAARENTKPPNWGKFSANAVTLDSRHSTSEAVGTGSIASCHRQKSLFEITENVSIDCVTTCYDVQL